MSSNSASTRSLTKSQLGGVIFGCKNNTMQECLQKQLFGLPAPHFSYVKNIEPGLPLFLFNYSDRKLHGIFEAASSGQMSINPYGWTGNGAERTSYPAQVQIRIRLQCRPLAEDHFKPIIADNYYTPHHFWFELDHAQTNKLISKLSFSTLSPGPFQPYYTEKRKSSVHPATLPASRVGSEVISQSDPDADSTSPSNDGSKRRKGKTYMKSGVEVEAEKDLIYMKLQELALNRDRLNSYLADSAQDTSAIDEISLNKKGLLDGQGHKISEDENEVVPVVSFGTQTSVVSNTPLIITTDSTPTIGQLVEEIKELKTLQSIQTQEMVLLRRRLDDAEAEILRLKKHCSLLESTSDHSLSQSGVAEPMSFDEKNWDPSELIYLIGGYDGKNWLSTLDLYSISLDAKKPLSSMSCARSYAAVAKLNGEIYALGGGDGSDWCDTVESYNVDLNKWTTHASLHSKKGSLAAVTVGGKIFAVGGGNGLESLSDVEMFDPEVGRWIPTRSMLQKRFALGAIQLNNAMYVTGGFDGQDYLGSVERFDPREHSWTKIGSLNIARGCHSMVVLDEKMYVLGGFDGSKMITSVEVCDPRMGTWMGGDSMNFERGYASAAVVGGGIFVIGGIQTDENILDIVERYEEGKGWEVMSLNAIGKRCFGSAFVL